MLRSLKRLVSRPVKQGIRSAQAAIRAGWGPIHKRLVFRSLAPLVPPEALMHDGPPTFREFKQNANEFLQLYVELCGLKEREQMLDVGCGIGRKTILLTRYLDSRGSYDGIDIVKAGIDWCSSKISTKHSNFRFQLIDVYNRHYNPAGRQRASDYSFPFPDGSFDFVTLGSVFTHMLQNDTENYLAQVRRVLRSDGRCLISWFLLNTESRGLVGEGRSTLPITHPVGNVTWTSNLGDPEAAIGYDEDYVRRLYEQCGFVIKDRIHYGSWCGRERFLSYQDLILATAR